MTDMLIRPFRRYPQIPGGPVLFFLLLIFLSGIRPWAAPALAAEAEVLTPRTGATIVARTPETHLVLRQPWNAEKSRVQVQKSGAILDPVTTQQFKDHSYLHFRLPLTAGENSFKIFPGGKKIEFGYREVQADLNPNSFGKDVFLFHSDDRLPAGCEGCHDLQKSSTMEPVGIKQQTSCATCHKNVIEKFPWKHSTTINLQCLTCHLQSARPWRIGFPPQKVQEICLICHTGKRGWESRDFVHGPMYIGGCTLCHSPHGGKYRYQLWADGSVSLCIVCHSDKESLVRKEKPLPFVHGIIHGQGCVACHDPHYSDHQFMLSKPINELCTSCHTGLAGIVRGHPVGGHPVAGPTERRRPGRKLTCVSCHDPHGSRFQDLLIGDKRGGNVCIACHR